MAEQKINAERRFGGLNRLYGDNSVNVLQSAHVMVAGIGGVGSWCAEALARSGIGRITLIDMDHISESNINRQLPALGSTLGQAKITAMQQRILDINPYCEVHTVDDFIGADNVQTLLAQQPNVLIDCTDQADAKIAMILAAKRAKVKLYVCGAAGGKRNPLALKRGDLSQSTHDAMLARLRARLRKEHNFARPKVDKKKSRTPKMGVEVFWIEEQAVMPAAWQPAAQDAVGTIASIDAPQGLSCAGYGSSVTVTAPMGFAAAQAAIDYALASVAT